VLVLLLDLAAWDRTPAEQERVLLDELGRYRPELLERPRLVVGSKLDVAVPEALAWFREVHPEHTEGDEYGGPAPTPGCLVSAAVRQGLDRFQGLVGELVDAARQAEPDPESWVVLRPASEGFAVVRDDDGLFRVTGRSAERVVAMADLTNEDALRYVQHRLRRMGVDKALARAGARSGDVVRIGPVELEWSDEAAG
jgi:GTP-binding protein